MFDKYVELGLYDRNIDTCEQFNHFFDEEHLIPEHFLSKLAKRGIVNEERNS